MGLEIERKFLVKDESWRVGASGLLYRQGYIATDTARTVRVRTMGQRAALTVKSLVQGPVRQEYEYDIPVVDADEMLDNICLEPLIEKRRYRVPVGGHVWEVDEFFGINAPLVVAEIELTAADEAFERPRWLGPEVTDDARYLNANLVSKPFSTW